MKKEQKFFAPAVAKWLLAAVILLATAGVFRVAFSQLKIYTDSAYYAMGAQHIAEGKGFTAYNIGFLADDAEIAPWQERKITAYYPAYSFFVGIFIALGMSTVVAAKLVNSLFWLIFFLGWLNFFRLIFKENPVLIISSALLLLWGAGGWTYTNVLISEPVFIASLAVLANGVVLYYAARSTGRKLLWLLLMVLASAMLVLSRKAGISIVAATFFALAVQAVFQRTKARFFHALVYGGLFTVLFLPWWLRNFQIAEKAAPYALGNDASTIFDFPRIFELLNYFFTDTLNLPARTEPFAALLLVLFTGIIAWLLIKKPDNMTREKVFPPVVLWLLAVLIFYAGMIVFVGIFHHGFNRYLGLARYHYLMQPLLAGVLLWWLRVLHQSYNTNIISKLAKYIIAALLFVSAVSGLNRSRVFFATLLPEPDNTEVFRAVKENVTTDDVLYSNHWQKVTAQTAVPAIQIGSALHLQQLSDSLAFVPQNTYLFLYKGVGYTYRQDVEKWNITLQSISAEIISENENAVFVMVP